MTSTTNIATTLAFRHVFGISHAVTDNVSVLDDSRVAYVAGHSLIVHDKQENRQQLLQAPDIIDTITAFTVGTSRKHAAVAEKGDRPKIHVFDLTTARLKKTLIAVDVKGKVSSPPYNESHLSSQITLIRRWYVYSSVRMTR